MWRNNSKSTSSCAQSLLWNEKLSAVRWDWEKLRVDGMAMSNKQCENDLMRRNRNGNAKIFHFLSFPRSQIISKMNSPSQSAEKRFIHNFLWVFALSKILFLSFTLREQKLEVFGENLPLFCYLCAAAVAATQLHYNNPMSEHDFSRESKKVLS